MSARYLLIVNPCAAGGSTGRRWPQIEERLRAVLPPFDSAVTPGRGGATGLAAAAAGKYEVIVAVGGDGTLNEVLNGLIAEDGSPRADASLGVVPLGTGGDFARTLGIPRSLPGAAAVLARGRARPVDVGRARFRAFDGRETVRYFINAAEVGLGAAVCQTLARSDRRLGGVAAYARAIALTSLRYRDRPVTLVADGGPPQTVVLNNLWVANGCYSGAGIRSAPRARLDDGLLDLVRVEHAGVLERLRGFLKLRSGAFVEMAHVDYRTARCLEVTAETPVPVETDGEPVGTLPARFDLLPWRLSVIA